MNYLEQNKKMYREVIGLVPAAGNASRIAPLPCSKEMYPVGFRTIGNDNSVRPKVVSHYLLEKMRLANISKVFIILRRGKWDIPAYFGDGKMLDMDIGYLIMNLPFGVPYTLDQAYSFVDDYIVALGFPDIIFYPDDAYVRLLSKLKKSNADVVLGLFPTYKPHKTDMVEMDDEGRIRSISIKPNQTKLIYSWEIAVWTPVFTRFLHNYLLSRQKVFDETRGVINLKGEKELFVGDVIQAAIEGSISVDSVVFKDGSFLDIGTPEDLAEAVRVASQIL